MPKVSLNDYYMGRDKTHPFDLSTSIRANAERTVDLVNKLLARADEAGLTFEINPRTKSLLISGWRPPAINSSTKGAAVNSKHLTGEACDIYDPDGDLDEWLMGVAGQLALKELGLWLEHPAATKGWCHVQTKPPNSGRRVFYP